jgi:hypothetical protein
VYEHDEESPSGGEYEPPRFEQESQHFEREPSARIDGARRWLTMALVGAVVGIVAALAIHGLRGAKGVARGRRVVAQPVAVAPAGPEARAPDGAPRRRSRGGSRANARGRRAGEMLPAPSRTALIHAAGVTFAVPTDAALESHHSASAASRVPTGAEYEFGFER